MPILQIGGIPRRSRLSLRLVSSHWAPSHAANEAYFGRGRTDVQGFVPAPVKKVVTCVLGDLYESVRFSSQAGRRGFESHRPL
jgi:hypothetical protein